LPRSVAGSSRGQNRFGHADGARTEFAVGRSTSVKMGFSPVSSWSSAASVTALTVTRSIPEAISAGIAALARMQGADGSFPLFTEPGPTGWLPCGRLFSTAYIIVGAGPATIAHAEALSRHAGADAAASRRTNVVRNAGGCRAAKRSGSTRSPHRVHGQIA